MNFRAAPVAPIHESIWHGSEDPEVKTGTAEFKLCTGVSYTMDGITWKHYDTIRNMLVGLYQRGEHDGKVELSRQIKLLMPIVHHDVESFFND